MHHHQSCFDETRRRRALASPKRFARWSQLPQAARLVALMLLSGAATVAFALGAPAADAAQNPTPVDVQNLDPVPLSTWGVSGMAPELTQTPSLDVLVWDFQQVGDRMFVAGGFLNVQENADATPIPQPYVAAFDLQSGDWVSTWTPQLDRVAYTLDVLPSGSLLVGGEFEQVNGVDRVGLVALDPITGEIDAGFAGSVDRPWSDKRAVVRQLRVEGDLVYVAGNFSHFYGADGTRVRMYKVGRFLGSDGTIDSTWQPEVTGAGLWGLDANPVVGEVYLTGYFTAVNGEENTGHFHTVDDATGATVPGKIELPRNYPSVQPEMYDVTAGNDLVFVIGEQHITQVLQVDDQEMVGFHHTGLAVQQFELPPAGFFSGGAFQVGERIGDVVFAGCHCTYSVRDGLASHYSSFTGARTPHRLAMAYDASTGELIEEFMPDINSPRDGVWAVGSDTNGCLYVGGDLHVGGVDSGESRWLGGFAKLCPEGQSGGPSNLVDGASDWRYFDQGEAPAGWEQPGFDDSVWPSGQAELGFGDNDGSTMLTAGNPTYYFRKSFTVDGDLPASLNLYLKADDGAVVYLNGNEVLRDNLPDVGLIEYSTPAVAWRSGDDEGFALHVIPATELLAGENTVAVEVHNVWSGNGDLGFDLRISESNDMLVPETPPLITGGSTWRYADSAGQSAPATWPNDLPSDGPTASAQFGFGGDGEVTELAPGQETYYFATTFELTNEEASALDELMLRAVFDDGAVVYFNGVEVLRRKMPDGAIAWNTRPTEWASGADEELAEYTVPGGALVAGTNTVTVEVHNYWPGNSDLSFDLSLWNP